MIDTPTLRIVGTRCTNPEREAEFNKWYDKFHAPEVVSWVPGVKSGTRYVVVDPEPWEPAYIALYEMTDPKDIGNYLQKKDRGEARPFTGPYPPFEMLWHVNLRLHKVFPGK